MLPGHDLISRLLTYDPEKRITSHEAEQHEYFKAVRVRVKVIVRVRVTTGP